jgi:sugar-specific transcriptional regulator TrmB
MAIQEKDEVIENLQSKNEELLRYIDLLERSEKMQHQGKDISETKKKSRTLKNVLSRAETALWFAKSFRLELESMTVKEINSNVRHNLVVDNSGTGNTDNVSAFDALSDDDKGKVEKVLFLLD